LAGATWPTQTSMIAVARTPRKLIRSCMPIPFVILLRCLSLFCRLRRVRPGTPTWLRQPVDLIRFAGRPALCAADRRHLADQPCFSQAGAIQDRQLLDDACLPAKAPTLCRARLAAPQVVGRQRPGWSPSPVAQLAWHRRDGVPEVRAGAHAPAQSPSPAGSVSCDSHQQASRSATLPDHQRRRAHRRCPSRPFNLEPDR